MVTFYLAMTLFSVPQVDVKQFDTVQAACHESARLMKDPYIIQISYDPDSIDRCCSGLADWMKNGVAQCKKDPIRWDCNLPKHWSKVFKCVSTPSFSTEDPDSLDSL